ncbi:PRC-barrel domain-containing protein [Craurococcus roseus]|uniref:PRC-barrel domain-containing protein n=1 Tax=Craurococcus roseus TaxID=77585 RepID=A0ABN1F2L2_9PROT
MLKRFSLKACFGAALAGALLAQVPSTAPAQGQPDGARQTLPGWGGTQPLQSGQAPPPGGGLVAVVPGQVVVTYYAVQPADMTASGLMRTDVYNLQDERLGKIEDLVIGGGREIAAIVIGVGGFLGIGERYAALPPSAVVLTRQPNGSMRAVVDATRDQLRNSPEFKYEGHIRR